MHSEIPAVYTDKHGSIQTTINNDSVTLSIELDGIVFSGDTFIYFQPETTLALPGRFTLGELGQLTDYTLSCRIPISTWKEGIQIPGVLLTQVEYKEAATRLDYNAPYFHFSFELEEETIQIGKLSQFEGVFEILREKLPENIDIKTCYTCLYSDYSVYGNDIFGTMLCFRNAKDKYVKVKDKDEYMDMMDDFDRIVQETYLCEDFTPRIKGTGYRG
ncbi:DUF6304 family protein [Chitinophaga sp. CF418]|uniref:DUF6304 family protein n=1 Tax=Chitinophaga sp. CF418 TaxID=1855287 RepID=UPI00091BFFF2|nr:DUF6304 family protein [Chitinophaga sp. CF418]SHM14971.1 hypothetical protein SAMN05216311_101723 [Chitinophaga sp. CF418]